MKKESIGNIPLSPALRADIESQAFIRKGKVNRKRMLYISLISIAIAVIVSSIAKLLVYLIDLTTNIAFFGSFSVAERSPAESHLGVWVIVIPAVGGLIVGVIAYYGSQAIRGHGIPEAMEQILTNQSRIKPSITILKPLSSAISIGTGGPFGAEGPIIATGGAMGSFLGQMITVTHHERKILLAAGATAGMSAIFGSPLAAIFLAIELLLFEFSARSIIPVALACITGAAGHQLLFASAPVFPMSHPIHPAQNAALGLYSLIGVAIGLASVVVTKLVYFVEDLFEKLPVHWMWWPALGGLVVGVIGYFNASTLGVGYSNITGLLSASLTVRAVTSLCLLKLISWVVSLGSGTSGGTLAPLLTIGGGFGWLAGVFCERYFPGAGISVPLAALVGMSAMFAGASRAFITSIIFAIETTSQENALLPLLATCAASFIVSYFFMDSTIMTEKISRRGVRTPSSYEPDVLEGVSVAQAMHSEGFVILSDNKVGEVLEWLHQEPEYRKNYFVVANSAGEYNGLLSSSSLFSHHQQRESHVGSLIRRRHISVGVTDHLRKAVELMAAENVDVLPVLSGHRIVGVLSYQDIISVYAQRGEDHVRQAPDINGTRVSLKVLIGKKLKTLVGK